MQIHKWYTKFVLRLNIPLYPTTAIISQSDGHATSIPKSQATEYFKSVHHVCKLYSYQCVISTNLFLHRKYTSKSMELQTMRAHIKFQILRTGTYRIFSYTTRSHDQQSTPLVIHRSHFFLEGKIDHMFPLNNIWTKYWTIHTYITTPQATNLTITNTTTVSVASCNAIHNDELVWPVATSITTKRLDPHRLSGVTDYLH